MDRKRLSAVLSALAQPTRLAAMKLILDAGADGLPSSEIAAKVHSEPSNMSVHLRVLAMAKLVASERRSKQIVYSADVATIDDALAELSRQLGRDGKASAAGATRTPRKPSAGGGSA